MFELEAFVEECKSAVRDADGRDHIKELVERAVSDQASLLAAIGEPSEAGVNTLYQADDLTILNLVWGPQMNLYPHNHEMWAVIGIYGGTEDNTFYRRADGPLTRYGTKRLESKDTVALGESIIHSVYNPRNQLTGALHVYGGDFFETPRSEWDEDGTIEQPYSVEGVKQAFAESNALWRDLQAQA